MGSRSHKMRLLTAFLVLCLSGFAVFEGCNVISFAEARTHVADADAIRKWLGVPGLSSAALEATLTPMRDAPDIDAARRRAEDLGALLAVYPMSGANWLALAGMRLAIGQPYERVVAALAMSSLTAPNEGVIMVHRGIFGLLQWEALPEDARQRTANDLAGAIAAMLVGKSDAALIKTTLEEQSADTRSQIRNLLATKGVSPAELARSGL